MMTERSAVRLHEEDIELIVAKISGGGASVTVTDPRVSQIQNWLIGLVGLGIIASLGWLANSVDSLNRNFAAVSQWKEYVDRRLDQLEARHGNP
jgi:hypothetical protein